MKSEKEIENLKKGNTIISLITFQYRIPKILTTLFTYETKTPDDVSSVHYYIHHPNLRRTQNPRPTTRNSQQCPRAAHAKMFSPKTIVTKTNTMPL